MYRAAYVSNILTCDAPGSIVDTPQSGTRETPSFLSPRASPEHSDLQHPECLRVVCEHIPGSKQFGVRTFEIAHVTRKEVNMKNPKEQGISKAYAYCSIYSQPGLRFSRFQQSDLDRSSGTETEWEDRWIYLAGFHLQKVDLSYSMLNFILATEQRTH